MQQLLIKVAAQEESWHSSDEFATPAKIRLQQHLRTCRLKCNMVEPGGRQHAGGVLVDAARASANVAPAPAPVSRKKGTKWEPKPLVSIDGAVVFGPWVPDGGVVFSS